MNIRICGPVLRSGRASTFSSLCAYVGMVLAFAASLSAYPVAVAPGWNCGVEMRLDIDTPTYSRHETQTWVITGPPQINGSTAVYPVRWHYQGHGSAKKLQGRDTSTWTWNIAEEQNAHFSVNTNADATQFTVIVTNDLPPINGTLTGTQQVTRLGAPPPPVNFKYTVNPWSFGLLYDDMTRANPSGSSHINVPDLPGVLANLYSGQFPALCNWHFVHQGYPPPAPPPSVNKPIAAPTKINQLPVATRFPSLASVIPNSGQQWTDRLVITFKGANTSFVQNTTTVDLGPGITLIDPTVTVTSPVQAVAAFKIHGNATPGPHTVRITTGNEVVRLTNGFTVTPLDSHQVIVLSPETGQRGQQSLTVSITRPIAYFTNGTYANFGPGITVTGVEFKTQYNIVAHLNIDVGATPGPRTVTITRPLASDDDFPGVFTVAP